MSRCYKLAFHSPEQAERTAEIIVRQGLRDPSMAPRRIYLCPHCDKWHWTSSPASLDGTPSVSLPPVVVPPAPPVETPPPPVAIKAPSPLVPRQVMHAKMAESAQAAKRRSDRLEANLSWAKNHLRVAASRWIRERSEEAAIEMAVAINDVVCLSKSEDATAPDAMSLREANAAGKRDWLRSSMPAKWEA